MQLDRAGADGATHEARSHVFRMTSADRAYHVQFGVSWGVDAEPCCNRVAVVAVEPFTPAG